MCRIVEDIAKAERHEVVLKFVRSLAVDGFSVSKIAHYTECSEDEVLAALKELGLPAPTN